MDSKATGMCDTFVKSPTVWKSFQDILASPVNLHWMDKDMTSLMDNFDSMERMFLRLVMPVKVAVRSSFQY
jgi:hypothetical protein